MPAETFYVGAYWGPRGETVSQCAGRLWSLLASLGEADSLLSSWFKTGRSRGAALKQPINVSTERLRELLLEGQPNIADGLQDVMSDLGFRASLWTGQDVEVGLSVRCGSPLALSGVTSNALVLQLPVPEGDAMVMYRQEVALAIIRSIVTAWQPTWCTWTSDSLRNAQGAEPNEVIVGWATYLANSDGVTIDHLPAQAIAQRFGSGILILADGAPCSVSEVTVSAVRGALGRALRPTF